MQVCMGIIRAIRNYPDDLSGAVCIRLLFRTPSLRPNGTKLSSPWCIYVYMYTYLFSYLCICTHIILYHTGTILVMNQGCSGWLWVGVISLICYEKETEYDKYMYIRSIGEEREKERDYLWRTGLLQGSLSIQRRTMSKTCITNNPSILLLLFKFSFSHNMTGKK